MMNGTFVLSPGSGVESSATSSMAPDAMLI
jgi:hypothetical protein